MSGGGSGDSSGWRPSESAAGGGAPNADPCDIIEVTILNSPDSTVLAGLSKGNLLDVVYQAGPPQQLLAEVHGQKAGSITSPSMLQIIRCITTQGRQYVAEVIKVSGAICQVRVRPK